MSKREFAIGALGFVAGAAVATVGTAVVSQTLPVELQNILKRIRITVNPPLDGPQPWIMYPMQDSQSMLYEVAIKDNHPWFKSMCVIGMEDRGLPYDGLGHGEVTFRIWWAKSPNIENYPGDMWFTEQWCGGAWDKTVEYLDVDTWRTVMKYKPIGAIPNAIIYLEIHPDGHIMNPPII